MQDEEKVIKYFTGSINLYCFNYPKEILEYFISVVPLLGESPLIIDTEFGKSGHKAIYENKERFLELTDKLSENKDIQKLDSDMSRVFRAWYIDSVNNDEITNDLKIIIGNNFISLIKNVSVIENKSFNDLTDLIDFIKEKNQSLQTQINSEDADRSTSPALKWMAPELKLKLVSEELFEMGCTKYKLGFQKVFTEKKVCDCKGKINFLIELMFALSDCEPPIIQGAMKEYQELFRDLSSKDARLISFSDRRYRLSKNAEEYSRIKASVGKFISKFFN